jgi:autotransporter-associated beta strand protein
MVIDDNGHGLSTTGLGHGDAQHHGDFNPYAHGHEIFACNEDEPANNYRDATTSKLYYRKTDTSDDGRCMAGNFTNDYPGAMAFSAHDEPISCVTSDHIDGLTKDGLTDNFRIYWDGDLLEECFNYTNGKNTAGGIYKYGQGLIAKLEGSMTNNDTKGTPCYQGDILGDWREEVVMRTKDNKIRIYTTTIPTEWRNYTLWHDHQYRNAMAWQMCGYNQPPHVSYFLGELEGITQAPPPLTTMGRVEIRNGGSISSEHNGAQVLLAETGDMEVTITEPCLPEVIIDNAPSWVQGHDDNDRIEYGYYTHTLKMNRTWMGGLSGSSIRLVKQGDGTLRLEDELVQSYGGPTDVWAGTIVFSSGKVDSHVWLNRFAKMETSGAYTIFSKIVEAEYGSVIRPGGNHNYASLGIDTLKLGFGSVLELDLINPKEESDHLEDHGYLSDNIGVWKLVIEKKDWQYGPEYKAPVLRFISNLDEGDTSIPAGKYEILQANEIVGDVEDLVIEGLDGLRYDLSKETNADGFSRIYLTVKQTRSPLDVSWVGDESNLWDFAHTENFLLADGTKGFFVTGDKVTFGDDAVQTDVCVGGNVSPSEVVFTNDTKDYTLSGQGSIIGDAKLTKSGNGNLTVTNTNQMTGGVMIEGGQLSVTVLANNEGTTYGALGGVDNTITLAGGTLAVTNSIVSSHPIRIEDEGTISVASGKYLTQNGTVSSNVMGVLTKQGKGTLQMDGVCKYEGLQVCDGTVRGGEISDKHQYPSKVVLYGGTLKDPDNIYSYSTNNANVEVPEDAKASWTLDSRCDYKGRLTGSGTLTVNVTSVRCNMQGDWSQFEGTLNFVKQKTGSYDPLIQWNNDYGLGKATVMGEFDNSGKNVTIGTLSDKVTLTGSGRYTVNHLDLTISKSKSGLLHSYIEVAGTMMLAGDITVTLKGTLKARDEVTLWKCGSLQTSSNLVVNLPELPEGLYWDTTEFLKKEGKLKVTDTPTGIGELRVIRELGEEGFYDLQGRKVSTPRKGLYIKNGKKIIIK